MIRRNDGADWLLIAQPDHAALCGTLAERWGTAEGPFAPVGEWEAVLYAAREHDNGWIEWEAAPTVDAAGRPRNFLEMPVAEVLPVWRRGTRRAAECDPYGGLLVSLHATRIFWPRYQHGRDAPEERESLRLFLEEQEAFRSDLQRRVPADQAVVWAHSALIGLWDRLSLLCCCGPIPHAVLEKTPARRGALDLRVIPDSERSAALDPYPFAGGPLTAAAPA
ncbi:MAG TPA: DUF3891 family protein, partial [Candidatus Methylomirabilis sp.]